jgi:hypothetical protein
MAKKSEQTDANQTIQERQDNLQVGQDNVDESANTVQYAADVGFTVTSHGDGTPSISPQLVERRAEIKEFNANPDRDNVETAKNLGLQK